MTKDEARKAAEIMLAYADGEEIQYFDNYKEWRDIDEPSFDWAGKSDYYRIKAEPKYRHFNSTEECWQEMQKHQPLGWVKDKEKECYFNICCVGKTVELYPTGICALSCSFEDMMHGYTFVDGTTFGKQVE